VNQGFLSISVSAPMNFTDDYSDPSATSTFATLEFDLVKDTVKLPGGFVCQLASLAQALDAALSAQKRLGREQAFRRRSREELYR